MDTHNITEIYMQRPQSARLLFLGEWFNKALELDDEPLNWCNSKEAKKRIVDLKYNELPNLEARLKQFNSSFKE